MNTRRASRWIPTASMMFLSFMSYVGHIIYGFVAAYVFEVIAHPQLNGAAGSLPV